MKTIISTLLVAFLFSFSAHAQNNGLSFANIDNILIFYKSTPANPFTVSGEMKFSGMGKQQDAAMNGTFGIDKIQYLIGDAQKKVAKGKMSAFDAVIVPPKMSSLFGKLQFIKFTTGSLTDNMQASCMVYGKGKKAAPVYIFAEPTKPFKEVGKVKTGLGGTMFQANQTGDEIDKAITGLLEKAQKEKIEFDALYLDAPKEAGAKNFRNFGGEAKLIKFD
jgi:hypothetical protein